MIVIRVRFRVRVRVIGGGSIFGIPTLNMLMISGTDLALVGFRS